MARSILVPLDGSKLAEAALPYAMALARALGISVSLLHVVEKAAPSQTHGDAHVVSEAGAEAYLAALEERLRPEGIAVSHHVHAAPVSRVARSIAAHRAEMSYDLAVICTHGGGDAARLLLGSVAQRVFAEARVPVLVVRPDAPAPEIRSILVALEATHGDPLPLVREIAVAFRATVRLLMVIPTFGTRRGDMRLIGRYLPGSTQEAFELETEAAQELLAGRRSELEAAGLTVSAEVARGAAAALILQAVERYGPELTVMATHGRRGLGAFWSGSVASEVCARCGRPVLLVPAE